LYFWPGVGYLFFIYILGKNIFDFLTVESAKCFPTKTFLFVAISPNKNYRSEVEDLPSFKDTSVGGPTT
jgi:hypothetical protein